MTAWKTTVSMVHMRVPRIGPVRQRIPLVRNRRLDGTPHTTVRTVIPLPSLSVHRLTHS